MTRNAQDHPPQIEALLSSAQVAEALQIPTATLAAWASRGAGPAYVRIGKHRRYRQSAVEQWMAALPAAGPRGRRSA